MSIRFPALFFAFATFCAAEEDSAVVRFSNGDRLTGNVISLSGEKLSWKSQILMEPSEFDLRHIVDLNMPASKSGNAGKGFEHKAVLEMTNGDVIEGQLAGVSADEVRLSTWYAGEMKIRRVNVKSVKIARVSGSLYRGPNSLEEWTVSKGGGDWQFGSGSLHSKSPGGIAREVPFSDECVIAFDAAWRGSFRPKIIFFSNDINTNSPDAGYEMLFQGNSVQVRKCGTNNWLGHSTNIGRLRENEKSHIEIKASKKTGKILLYVDGEVADLWQDDELAGTKFGNGLHFVSQDNSPLRISKIEVTEWDGYHEDVPNRQNRFQGRIMLNGGFQFGGEQEEEEKPPEETVPEGRMLLVNGDSIEGEVTKVEGEDITLKTPFTEVTFPIVRLKNIVLAPAGLETPKRYKGDVRATLADGSRMVFRFDGVDEEGRFLGFSQNFGQARFAKDAFQRLEFNVHDEAMETMRLRDDW